MKKKLKKILKNKIFIFILGGIFFSTISVYTVTYFSSNDVSYNNSSSGLSSTNVKSAIDELYEICTRITSSQIIDGLEKDPYECRYFFTGASLNNYITFNNETWRIISAECDGTIKIIKIDDIGYMEWNSNI